MNVQTQEVVVGFVLCFTLMVFGFKLLVFFNGRAISKKLHKMGFLAASRFFYAPKTAGCHGCGCKSKT